MGDHRRTHPIKSAAPRPHLVHQFARAFRVEVTVWQALDVSGFGIEPLDQDR
jgi:hypothetical protein